MCYPKPGPRCSAHATATFAKAHQKVLTAFMSNVRGPELDKLIKVREKAQKELRVTPAGIHELSESYKNNPTAWRLKDLEEAQAARNLRLEAVKDVLPKTHRIPGKIIYEETPQLQNGDEITEMSYSHPNLLASIKDSERWSHSLTGQEIATIAKYSQGAFGDINGHLVNPNFVYENHLSKETVEEMVTLMDSALSKHVSTGEVTVYRRHLSWNSNYSYDKLTTEQIQQKFQPGSVFEPGFYMSTSLNPDNLPTQAGNVIAMEIKTKTAVPVTSVSSQGPREYEFILPRQAKFRVVANHVKVNRSNNFSDDNKIVVIQLEEI